MVSLRGYRILSVIGTGGMGCVYEAEREETGERVAIKFVTAANISSSDQLKARMAREARAVSTLVSPHLVRVIEVGEEPDSGYSFLGMELLRGEDLQQLLDRAAPLVPGAALAVVAQACAGLQVAHEARVIHRDVKPANLYLSRDGTGKVTVKILDFGIAKIKMDEALGGATQNLTRTGSILGSPLYMSPEQARGAKNIDHRADVWSLGIVLYHSLTGRTPFHDIDALGELIMAICQQPTPLVQDFAPWVSPAVAAIVHRALRIDPAERFQSAAEMGAEIAKLLPMGIGLTEAALSQVPPGEKKHLATRLIVTGTPAMLRGGTTPVTTARSAPSSSVTDHSSTGGLTNSRETYPQRPEGRARLVGSAIGAAVVLAAVAAAVGFSMRHSSEVPAAGLSAPVAEASAPAPASASVIAPTSTTPPNDVPPSSSSAAASSGSPVGSSAPPAISTTLPPRPSAKGSTGGAKAPPGTKTAAPPDSASFGGRE